MKQIVLAAVAAIGTTAVAAPAQAVTFKWNVDYTGFFSNGASITGYFVADESAADDGVVSADEFDSWQWNWSGNSEVDAFSISSSNGEFSTLFGVPGFFVNGTTNAVNLADNLEQGNYSSNNYNLDLEYLIVEDVTAGSPITGTTTYGNLTAGSIAVSDPEIVPEPTTLLGLLTLAGTAAMVKRQKKIA